MTEARWLTPVAAAAYIGRRVDELARLRKRGLIPEPSYHFGPRTPRYDRLQLDALFIEDQGQQARSVDQAVADTVKDIIRRAGARPRH